MPLPSVRPHSLTPDIPALTGLRLIAALGVLLCHFSETDPDRGNSFSWGIFGPLFLHGAMGVDVFFVLSGFILAYVYGERLRSGITGRIWISFMQLRFAWLYPVHIATMLAMFAVYTAGRHLGASTHHEMGFTPYSIAANLTLTHAWFPGSVAAMNGPAWSISAEWFAYLFFPFLCLGLSRRRLVWSCAVAIGAVCAVAMTPHLTPLFQIALEFSFGVAVCELTSRSRFSVGPSGAWVALTLVFFSTYVLSLTDTHESRFTPGPHLRAGIMLASGVGFASLSRSNGVFSHLLSLRPIVYGGEISYSIYMCHWPIWILIHKGSAHLQLLRTVPHVWFMLLALVVTVSVSIACYHWIELPGRTALRRISFSRKQRELGGLAIGRAA